MVDGFKNLPYEERLRRLGLPSLTYRRERGDMIEIFKHIHTYDERIISSNFRRQLRPSRKHNFQLVEKVPADGVRGKQHNAFYFRTNRRWNELPPSVANAKTIDEFKNELDDAWREKATNDDEVDDNNADENEDA